MNIRSKCLAFTLVEILIVIAIILLIAALVAPTFLGAKASGKRAACITQMKQIGLALNLYREQFGEYPENHRLDPLKVSGFLSDQRLLMCPTDEFKGIWSVHFECDGKDGGLRQSYYNPFAKSLLMWKELLRSDPNPGILVCRTHGKKSEWYTLTGPAVCSEIPFSFEGPIQRMRQDSSIQMVPFSLAPKEMENTFKEFNFWKLFTDEPVSPRTESRPHR